MTIPVIPFVVGCTRSGTSLLTVLLDRHSRVAMLPETHLLRPFVGDRPGWQPGPTHEHLLLAAWGRAWYRLRDLQVEPLAVLERFRSHPSTPEGLLHTLLELWAERQGKPIAGEKTPQHLEVVDRILMGIPGARVVVIVRDGRAVVESLARPAWAKASQDDHVDTWVACARLADRWLEEFPEQVRLVRFEELATDPQRVLASVMAWYGLEIEPTQLEAGPSPTFRRWEDRWKLDAVGPVDSTRAEAWRAAEELLSAEQLGRLAPWLERFGYPEPARAVRAPGGRAHRDPPPAPVRVGTSREVLPLLLIGAQRAATGSLASWLTNDPNVAPPPDKEPSPLVTRWPLDRSSFLGFLAETTDGGSRATRYLCDLAPYYLLHPDLPRRARQVAPDARIVVILRDPVARAFSHWLNEWRVGAESLGFAEALAAEAGRLGNAEERLGADEGAVSFAHIHYSYSLRGQYAAQLDRWYRYYPASQILVLIYEELMTDPTAVWEKLGSHLGLDRTPAPSLAHKGLRWPVSREKLLRTPEGRDLRSRLASDLGRLNMLLGRHVPWAGESVAGADLQGVTPG